MKLVTFLDPASLGDLQQGFDFDVRNIELELVAKDGPNGVAGFVQSNLLFPSKTIQLDKDDVHLLNGVLQPTPWVMHIIYHELVHIEQSRRGFFYRLKMKFWRKRPYDQRPHEKEAFERTAKAFQGVEIINPRGVRYA
jgi:hypothetical protein